MQILSRLSLVTLAVCCALGLQGCLVAGLALGAGGTVIGTGAKVAVATAKAVIPGESKADREKREFKAWQKAKKTGA